APLAASCAPTPGPRIALASSRARSARGGYPYRRKGSPARSRTRRRASPPQSEVLVYPFRVTLLCAVHIDERRRRHDTRHLLLEPADGPAQAVIEWGLRFPVEQQTGERDVGTATRRIVLGQWPRDDARGRLGQCDDPVREFPHGKLLRITEVDRTSDFIGAGHHPQETVDKVVHVAESAGLKPIAEDGDVLAGQRLSDEVGDDTAIVRLHPRAVGVKDADDLGLHAVTAPIVEEQRL